MFLLCYITSFSFTSPFLPVLQTLLRLSFTIILIIPKEYPMAEPRRLLLHRHPHMGHNHHQLARIAAHDASASARPISRNSSGMNAPHAQGIRRFAGAPAPSYSTAGEDFYRRQAATRGQFSTSSLSTPNYHPQIGHAIPEMARNVAQNIHSYSPTSSFAPNNVQSAVAVAPSVTVVAQGYSSGSFTPAGGDLCRGQVVTQGQSSTSSLSTTNYHPQIGYAILEMADNAGQNIHYYSPTSSFTSNNGQPAVAAAPSVVAHGYSSGSYSQAGEGYRGQVVTQGQLSTSSISISTPTYHPFPLNVHPHVSPTVPGPDNNYSSTNFSPSFEDPYYNTHSFYGAQRHNPTQGSTDLGSPVIPAMRNDSLSYSPPMYALTPVYERLLC